MCAGSFQTGCSSRWAKLHPQKRSLTPCVGTHFTAKWILRCRSWCWFRQTLHCLMTHKLSLVVKWEAEPGRSQLGKPHAVCPSEQEICAWPCLPLNEWTIVTGVSDMWTVLLLGLCPSRESKQTVSPSDFTTRLLSFSNTSTNSGPEYSASQYPGSKIYSVLQGWLHWQPWRLDVSAVGSVRQVPFFSNLSKAEHMWMLP